MNALVNAAFSRANVVILLFIGLLAIGAYGYISIPKESSPEIPIPIIYISTSLEGISPEDSERMLVEPLEVELSSISGLQTLKGNASEGYANVVLEFEPGVNLEQALSKVRVAVDRAKPELPEAATEPIVHEVNTSLFPILLVILSGPVPERTLNKMSADLKTRIESASGVLQVDVGGARKELLEITIDPSALVTYNLSFDELIGQINRNNKMIAAGAIENDAGRMVLKVPGLIEDAKDLLGLPIKVHDGAVITIADVATVRRTFEDPTSFARINGQSALAIEVVKRSGANIIETVQAAKAAIMAAQVDWPDTVRIDYVLDESQQVEEMLSDLEANIIAAIILVMVVIVYALGLRSSILVGLAIPGAFLTGVAALWALGYTMNIVVLFSLILVVGMLVDGAIVTTELADRMLQNNVEPRKAYATAAKRMAWPIISSTATTLCVFLPLLFWQGTVGEFMKYLPVTVILTLGASLFMALVFIPVLGGIIGKRQPQTAANKAALYAAEFGDPRDIRGLTGVYVRLLLWVLIRPFATFLFAVAALLASFGLYGQYGRGVTFFPSIEPDIMLVQVRSLDNLSVFERDSLVRQVENRLLQHDEVVSVYAEARVGGDDSDAVIGTVQLELDKWDTRRPAAEIGEEIRTEMRQFPGIDIQIEIDEDGPSAGKPINLQVLSRDTFAQMRAVVKIEQIMSEIGGFTDITDNRSLPGVEWRILVNRAEAARFGADINLLGQAIQLLTHGVSVATYRPASAVGTVDIRVRFPARHRSLEALHSLKVPTQAGLVPITNFVTISPAPKVGNIKRTDQKRVLTIEANVTPHLLVDDQIEVLRGALDTADLPQNVEWSFAGEAQEQQDAMVFLAGAFVTAILLMFAILMAQFNSFYQAVVVMTAIVFSIAGVLLGLLVTGRPFGVVMGGIGVIALAGIVVNNNIVLIDTYNDLRQAGMPPLEAALRTGAQRLRPVMLTSITTVLGLLPMVIGLNLNFFARTVIFGAPSTQWWTELSSAIAGGLVVATGLTLIVTPAMLMLGERKKQVP